MCGNGRRWCGGHPSGALVAPYEANVPHFVRVACTFLRIRIVGRVVHWLVVSSFIIHTWPTFRCIGGFASVCVCVHTRDEQSTRTHTIARILICAKFITLKTRSGQLNSKHRVHCTRKQRYPSTTAKHHTAEPSQTDETWISLGAARTATVLNLVWFCCCLLLQRWK